MPWLGIESTNFWCRAGWNFLGRVPERRELQKVVLLGWHVEVCVGIYLRF